MEHHLLYASSSLLLLFLFSSIPVTSQFTFGSSKQAHNYANVSCIENERQTLFQFKHGLIDESNRLSSWIGEECCSWKGISCHKTTGSVLKLDLRNTVPFYHSDDDYFKNCLGGHLSPSLVNLTNLRYLDLSLNSFSGIQVPAFFGWLKNLRYLNLSGAGFDGEIPHHLGNLSHLRYLDLGWNGLRTKDLGWVARLSSLEGLVLSMVNLTAALDGLQSINMLPSLTTLDLNSCDLFIHHHLSHVNFTSLAFLDFGKNNFNNYMAPPWLRNLTRLHDLSLGSNNLFDSIHDLFDQMTSLVHLDLSFNNFDVLTLKSHYNISSLTYLDLSYNNMHGSISSQIGKLVSLTHLDLNFNNLQGSIPSEIGQLPKLTNLLLSHNSLNGTIPTNLGQLTKLQAFDIGYNSLAGVLSEDHFVKLRELKSLDLTGNSLALNVSSSWVPPFQLQEILMGSIIVGPRFPAWLRTQNEVEWLDMRNASISDAIPSWFRVLCDDIVMLDLSSNSLTGNPLEFKQLKHIPSRYAKREIFLGSNKLTGSLKSFPLDISGLDLSHNFLTGHIPQLEVGQTVVPALSSVSLNDNRFTGTIPEDLCKLENLYFLDLSNNLLYGRVPLCLGNLRDLTGLSLANNNLSGQIPSSLGKLGSLSMLHLNGNKFIGKLPTSMKHLRNLLILDLGDNGLKDTIPAWIGEKLSKLTFLRFQSNNFHGPISDTLCQLSLLQVLNLAHNNLSGFIPHCFNNISAMVSRSNRYYGIGAGESLQDIKEGREFDYPLSNLLLLYSISLSANNLAGEIPNEIMELSQLQFLNLSQNHLTGRIPEKTSNLKQLAALDLSMNELFGAIPESLSALNSLCFLNLSHNKLSGPIPSGNQLQTLTDPSIYEGNSGLCGKPLPNNCWEHKLPTKNGSIHDDEGHGESDWSWFYAGIGPGFAVGLLGVLGILLFKKSWRYAYFKFIESACDKIWVKTTRLRRNFR